MGYCSSVMRVSLQVSLLKPPWKMSMIIHACAGPFLVCNISLSYLVPFKSYGDFYLIFTGSDIHYRILATVVLLTFLLKCCVMTQQEGIMQDVYTFAGTDQWQLPEYGPYSYICNLYTRIRAVRPSTCNVVCNAFGHLIRAPHYFQTLGCFSQYHPHPHPWPDGQGPGLGSL